MHELSIVMGILDIANREVETAGGGIVEEIELDIGELSTVQMEAFEFAWKQGIRGTLLENARLTVNRIAGRAYCQTCALGFPVQQIYDPCPGCGTHFLQFTNGKELAVRSITIEPAVEMDLSPLAATR